MAKRNIKNVTGKQVIHCSTKEENDALLKLMDEAGLVWCTKERYTTARNRWEEYKQETCYSPASGSYTEKDYYERGGYTIYPVSDFLEEEFPKIWAIKLNSEAEAKIVGEWFDKEYVKNMYATTLAWKGYHFTNRDETKSGGVFISPADVKEKNISIITLEQFKKHVLKQETNMQTVSRKAMKEIYDIACATWESRIQTITETGSTVFSDDIQVSDDNVKAMFEAATPSQIPVLEKHFTRPAPKFHSGMLKVGEIMEAEEDSYGNIKVGDYILKTYDSLVNLNDPEKTWNGRGPDVKGKKVPTGMSVGIKAK